MSSGYTLSRFSIFTFERPSLDQFVLLSLMLHVLFIILFGDTTGGGARRGEKMWGALTVTVQGLLPDSGVGLKLDRSATLLQRPGAAARPAPASPGTTPRNREAPATAPVEAPAPTVAAPPAQVSTFEMPPVISKDVEKAVTEFVVPKPSAERAYAPPTPTPPAEQPPREAPVVPPPPLPVPVIAAPLPAPVAPPTIERAVVLPAPLVTPVEPKPREEPVTATPPAPQPEPPSPKIGREVAKPVVSTPEAKPREIVPPVARPAELKPRELPSAQVAPPALSEPPARADALKPPKVEREVVTPTAPPAASVAVPPAAPVRTTSGTPSGAPDTDKDLLKPRGDWATPSNDTSGLVPAPATSKAPGIDLDAVRRRAREISSGGTGPRTIFPFPVAPQPKPKSREQQAFDKALKKNDCRDAYADMGLAAVVPLVLSAVREDGCKW